MKNVLYSFRGQDYNHPVEAAQAALDCAAGKSSKAFAWQEAHKAVAILREHGYTTVADRVEASLGDGRYPECEIDIAAINAA